MIFFVTGTRSQGGIGLTAHCPQEPLGETRPRETHAPKPPLQVQDLSLECDHVVWPELARSPSTTAVKWSPQWAP